MKFAIDETNRRRKLQEKYNLENNITPKSIVKEVRDLTEKLREQFRKVKMSFKIQNISDKNINKLIMI